MGGDSPQLADLMSEGSDAHGTQVTIIAVIEADNCDLIGNFAAYAQEVADESVSDFIVIADHRGTVAEVKLTEVFQYISVSIVQQIAPFLCGVPVDTLIRERESCIPYGREKTQVALVPLDVIAFKDTSNFRMPA